MASSSLKASSRAFDNYFPDFEEAANVSGLISQDGSQAKVDESFEMRVRKQIHHLLGLMESEYHIDWNDQSVYTGTSGVALLYYHLYKHYDTDSKKKEIYLTKAVEIMKKTIKNVKHRAISFLCGDAGPYAVGAVIFKADKKQDEYEKCWKKFTELFEKVNENFNDPDELLYGRSGLLFALLFLRKHLGSEKISDAMITKMTRMIIRSGKELGEAEGGDSPLMYQWHHKKYLGAAHGIAGIMHTLLIVKDDPYVSKHMDDLIKPTIEYLITLKFPNGNFPSSLESKDDRLVQWCHGAPGWIHMLLLAHEIFGEQKYLKIAKDCGKITWKRGFLKKGYGLCHGPAGNAYGFLALYNSTNDVKHLYRAIKFGEWCLDYGKHGCRIADRPYSLFEGMAGTIYFLADLLKPKEAKFPAYQI